MADPWDWGAFVEHRVDLPTGPLTYRRAGEGPPLVALHSAAGPRPSPVMHALAERHDVHMLFAPGFSATPRHEGVNDIAGLAKLVGAFLERFAKPVDLMGESFGGWLALRTALHFPDRVDHLVLEAPAGLRDVPPGTARPRIFMRAETAPAEGPHFDANRAAYASYGGGRFDTELAARLAEIRARTLVLIGTEDQSIPASSAQRIKAEVPLAHLTYIHDAGHGLEFDAHERVAPLIARFLEMGEGHVIRHRR